MKRQQILFTLPFLLLANCIPLSQNSEQKVVEDKRESYLGGFDKHLNPDGSFREKGHWDGDSLTGAPRIRISIGEQRAYFYKGDQLAGMSPISTGKGGGYVTPKGSFKITEKRPKHNSTLYGVIVDTRTNEVVNKDADSRIHKPGPGQIFKGAPMDNFMRFNGAVGMHTGFNPGYPASRGCVRMPEEMARSFFVNAPVGTEVVVDY
jgi:lipoprotein-anchoring transpeptidase ErfK/SrfK